MSLAVIFGLGVGTTAGWVTAGQFYAGYLTEYSLSLDNLFIFYVVTGWSAVPPGREHRLLLLGIGLALTLRSALIVAGAAALNRFGWLFYPLGGILVWTAVGLIAGRQDSQPDRQGRLMSWLQRHLAPGRLSRSFCDRTINSSSTEVKRSQVGHPGREPSQGGGPAVMLLRESARP